MRHVFHVVLVDELLRGWRFIRFDRFIRFTRRDDFFHILFVKRGVGRLLAVGETLLKQICLNLSLIHGLEQLQQERLLVSLQSDRTNDLDPLALVVAGEVIVGVSLEVLVHTRPP